MDRLEERPTERAAGNRDAEPPIPDKLYFRIGEVARLAAVKPYVLRFWESEFPDLGPQKSGTGQRLYRRKDVQMVFDIKRLLYEKRFTIAGARKMLATKPHRPERPVPRSRQGELFSGPSSLIAELRRELQEILRLLDHSPADN